MLHGTLLRPSTHGPRGRESIRVLIAAAQVTDASVLSVDIDDAPRLDRTVSASGRDNERGVIRAIEEFLGRSYDERAIFTDGVSGFLVTHRPNCNGFTVLRRITTAHSDPLPGRARLSGR